ncbi:DnaJ subfamily C member 24 [Mactra antiquata]
MLFILRKMENLYEILNCDQDVSFQTLKKSYQELALKYHPDKSKSGNHSTEKFIKINYAWKVLSDPWLRDQFDIKWKERCLAQSFPIQDTVDIDEFDVIETVKNGENYFNTNCNIGKSSGANIDDRDDNINTIASTDDTNVTENANRNSDNLTKTSDVNVPEDTETCDTNKGNTDCSLDEMGDSTTKEDDYCYTYPCRCGGNYTLTCIDYKLKFDIVCCDTCSLSVQVIYDDTENT